jgi:hypothetical protein
MRSPPPDEAYFLMTFFGFLVVGLYFLGKVSRKLKRSRQETESCFWRWEQRSFSTD